MQCNAILLKKKEKVKTLFSQQDAVRQENRANRGEGMPSGNTPKYHTHNNSLPFCCQLQTVSAVRVVHDSKRRKQRNQKFNKVIEFGDLITAPLFHNKEYHCRKGCPENRRFDFFFDVLPKFHDSHLIRLLVCSTFSDRIYHLGLASFFSDTPLRPLLLHPQNRHQHHKSRTKIRCQSTATALI